LTPVALLGWTQTHATLIHRLVELHLDPMRSRPGILAYPGHLPGDADVRFLVAIENPLSTTSAVTATLEKAPIVVSFVVRSVKLGTEGAGVQEWSGYPRSRSSRRRSAPPWPCTNGW